MDGTPADCVVLGLHLTGKPDLVVSGINLGPNLGDDLTHSGTVAAAIEGMSFGVPAIAFSQRATPAGEYDFAPGAAYAARRIGRRRSAAGRKFRGRRRHGEFRVAFRHGGRTQAEGA